MIFLFSIIFINLIGTYIFLCDIKCVISLEELSNIGVIIVLQDHWIDIFLINYT